MIVNRKPLKDWFKKYNKLNPKKLTEKELIKLMQEALVALSVAEGKIGVN